MTEPMTERLEADALVVGGGLAGLAMTGRLIAEGLSVVCVEAGPAPDAASPVEDLRTTAVLTPGVDTLRKAALWDAIAPEAVPIRGMRILDCGGESAEPREEALFEAQELDAGSFGWNIENGKARRAMIARLQARERATLLFGARIVHRVARRDAVLAALDDGRRIRARLLIGADGRASRIRADLGLSTRGWGYGQTALAFRVEHAAPHGGISTELHHVGGPLVFAPLAGDASGVVWMVPDAEAARLRDLSEEAFRAELQERSAGVVGEIRAVSGRAEWPAGILIATGLVGRRAALIAEAAHALPPIGAQGYNLSLRDVEALAALAGTAVDPGAPETLSAYARKRAPDISARFLGVDLLNRSVRSEARPVRDLRALALGTIGRAGPLRRMAMRAGMTGL